MKRDAKRIAVFQPEFREDLRFWIKSERSTAIKVLDLVEAVMRDPLQGPGKPEPLKYVLAGCWSRRITQEHRLVYRVTDSAFLLGVVSFAGQIPSFFIPPLAGV